ncbi:serine hydrolase [Microvirga pudoricolor]|uniref:serine hydrolase n=1 Tax=Microvirga pudoricolor TaxID=2778729 RepID=UPI0019526D31|nr:serine hydrolase [Microvirga pudoricolor]MBM6595599.1 serine hydrolase [Microvirga pudoricolor]
MLGLVREIVSGVRAIARREAWAIGGLVLSWAALAAPLTDPALAQDAGPRPVSDAQVQALVPEIEAYIASGMKAYDSPGLAIGIVAGDKLVYAKGFGIRAKGGSDPVDTKTVFQIGSATKAFLAATLGIMVDRKRFAWDDRVVDLHPDFQMKDPWVTREFRVFDLLAQRSGLPADVNDTLGILGIDEAGMIRSLRHVEPTSSFRSTFSYTNITHLLAGRIVATAANAPDWNAVLQAELLQPLGMADTSHSAKAIEAAPNHAGGHRWTPNGTVQVPFTRLFPYDFGGAGDINSTVEDMSRWLRLQLGRGALDGKRLLSTESLTFTHTPKIAMTEQLSYAFGWVVQQTPGGTIVWHNGGTPSFGSYVGLLPNRDLGIVVLTNETNVGFPDAIGLWVLDRVLGNARVDHVANGLARAKAGVQASDALFAKPADPRPFPPLAPLAGTYANPSFGKVSLAVEGEGLTMELAATGAKLRLDPWNGDVFTVRIVPLGPYAAMAENLGPAPNAFVQFQIDGQGKLDTFRLSMDDGQAYTFGRE